MGSVSSKSSNGMTTVPLETGTIQGSASEHRFHSKMVEYDVDAIFYPKNAASDSKSLQGKYHACIAVYGFLYECGADGIKKSVAANEDKSINVRSWYTNVDMQYRKYLGTTEKHLPEFDRWCIQFGDIFRKDKTHLWVIEACNFLGVAGDLSWSSMCQFAKMMQPSTVVEAVCWDLTCGIAETPIGKLNIQLSVPQGVTPPSGVYHTGVIAFGYLYEYGSQGITKKALENIKGTADPTSMCDVSALKSRIYMGQTTCKLQVFDDWCDRKRKKQYCAQLYDVSMQNCVMWSREALQFLGVTYPADWDNICQLAKLKGHLLDSKLASSLNR